MCNRLAFFAPQSAENTDDTGPRIYLICRPAPCARVSGRHHRASFGLVLALGCFIVVFTVRGDIKLSGTIIGTSGSWNNGGNTKEKAMDGDLATFFDAPTNNGD